MPKLFLNPAVLVPLVSLIAYAGTFLFEAGRLSFFGIPLYFLRLGTANVLSLGLIVFLTIFVVVLLAISFAFPFFQLGLVFRLVIVESK